MPKGQHDRSREKKAPGGSRSGASGSGSGSGTDETRSGKQEKVDNARARRKIERFQAKQARQADRADCVGAPARGHGRAPSLNDGAALGGPNGPSASSAAGRCGDTEPPARIPRITRAQCRVICEDTLARCDPKHPSIAATVAYGPADVRRMLDATPRTEPSAQPTPAAGGGPLSDPARASVDPPRMVIQVTQEGTIDAVARMARDGGGGDDVCALNFASAKNPGGGFINFQSKGQEESLCRSSGLYPCIKDSQVYSLAKNNNRSCLYHNFVVYSPAVPVWKDGGGVLYAHPFAASFVTCPAPNAGVARTKGVPEEEIAQTMQDRVDSVLAVCALHGQRRIVLGSWGTGCFGNDPKMVAEMFRRGLVHPRVHGAFDVVCFAVLDQEHAWIFRSAFKV
jgi:uncharacterized protein (TIGR02452 family)